MSSSSEKKRTSVKKDLQATADLLDALQNDPGILDDADFIERLSILRQKHEETTNFLARRLGAPPLPKMTSTMATSSSVFLPHQTPNPIDEDVYQCSTSSSSHHHRHSRREERVEHSTTSSSYHRQNQNHNQIHESQLDPIDMERTQYVFRLLDEPDVDAEYLYRQPVRQAPEPPRRAAPEFQRMATSSSSSSSSATPSTSSSRPTIQLRPPARHTVTSSVAMPSGLLLTNSITKRTPTTTTSTIRRLQKELAASSHVVEESFLEDGAMSTTRDIPTISDDVPPVEKPKIAKMLETRRSKSMQNVSEPKIQPPTTTVPKPFQLSLRKNIGNTYAKKFMSDMMEAKKRHAENDEKTLKTAKFKAKPVPKSTYQPTNTFATELKYVESMRRKVAEKARVKFDAQTEMVRSKSEGNLAGMKPLGYVPPSTYISPIPVKPNARSRSATTRSAILIQEATTPKGIKSHRHTSNLTHQLRHGRCKLDTSSVVQHRRISPPDFPRLHAKIDEEYRKWSGKPSTVPVPFKFASRSQSASTRHTNCGEKEPGQFLSRKPGSHTAPSIRIPSTHAAQLREELNRARIAGKTAAHNGNGGGEFWKEDNRKRIASFLGSRSKTEEDIAIRTRRKIREQQETTQEYMRELAQMKQRVLNGPLIMEKQSALAQEHRLKRKFEQRMKSATAPRATVGSRRNSETSAAGTFVVEKEYSEDFETSVASKKTSSHSEVEEEEDEHNSEASSSTSSTSSSSSSSTSSSSTSS